MERGLNKSGKLSEISSHLLDLQSDIIVFIETKVKIAKAKTIREKLKLKGNFIYNYSGHDNGRIWVEWDNANVDIKLVRSTNQMIHYGVYDLSGNFKHRMTYIYSLNNIEQRKKIWKDIENVHGQHQGAWCLIGDFNNGIKTKDRIGAIW